MRNRAEILLIGLAVVALLGGASGLARADDETIVTWGRNDCDQCATPDSYGQFAAVAGGWARRLGLRADSSVGAWGSNANGECNVPPPNSGFVSVSGGGSYSIGLQADGSIVLWGGWCAWPGKAHWTAVR